jgi:hypothetical protein
MLQTGAVLARRAGRFGGHVPFCPALMMGFALVVVE